MADQDAQDITQMMGGSSPASQIPIKKPGKSMSLLWVVLGCVVVGVGLGVVVYQRSLTPPTVPPTASSAPVATPTTPQINAVDKTMESNVITFPTAGTVRILYAQLKGGVVVPAVPTLMTLTTSTASVSVTTPTSATTPMAIIDTSLVVTAGQQVTMHVYSANDTSQPAIGWVQPNADNTCGRNGFGHIPIASQLAWAQATEGSLPLVSTMCWSESNPNPDKDTSAWAFNHYYIILTYSTNAASPSPAVSPSPTASPTNTPTPTPTPTDTPTPTPTPTVTPTPTASTTTTTGTTDTSTTRVAMPSAGSALPVAGVFEITEGTVGAGILLVFAGILGLLLL